MAPCCGDVTPSGFVNTSGNFLVEADFCPPGSTIVKLELVEPAKLSYMQRPDVGIGINFASQNLPLLEKATVRTPL